SPPPSKSYSHGAAARRRAREVASIFSAHSGPDLARALATAVLLSVSVVLWPVAKAGGDAAPALPPGVPAAERTRIENVLAHANISKRVEIQPFPLRRPVF